MAYEEWGGEKPSWAKSGKKITKKNVIDRTVDAIGDTWDASTEFITHKQRNV